MKILGIVDIHSKCDYIDDLLAEVEEVDLVLIGGDITNFGRSKEAETVLLPINKVAKRLYAVTGNCDHSEVDTFLSERDLHLENAPRIINTIAVIGVGGSLPCPSRTPHEHTEGELEQLLTEQLQGLPGNTPFISVTHQPPFETKIDSSLLAGHVGSTAVRAFIEQHQPLLSFSGHIHESVGVDMIGSTTIVNPGPFLKGYYFVADIHEGSVHIELKRLR